jgi:hypothetical protein
MENLSNQYIEDQKTRFHEEQLFLQPKQKTEEYVEEKTFIAFQIK